VRFVSGGCAYAFLNILQNISAAIACLVDPKELRGTARSARRALNTGHQTLRTCQEGVERNLRAHFATNTQLEDTGAMSNE
jgi:hypothetical protein